MERILRHKGQVVPTTATLWSHGSNPPSHPRPPCHCHTLDGGLPLQAPLPPLSNGRVGGLRGLRQAQLGWGAGQELRGPCCRTVGSLSGRAPLPTLAGSESLPPSPSAGPVGPWTRQLKTKYMERTVHFSARTSPGSPEHSYWGGGACIPAPSFQKVTHPVAASTPGAASLSSGKLPGAGHPTSRRTRGGGI